LESFFIELAALWAVPSYIGGFHYCAFVYVFIVIVPVQGLDKIKLSVMKSQTFSFSSLIFIFTIELKII